MAFDPSVISRDTLSEIDGENALNVLREFMNRSLEECDSRTLIHLKYKAAERFLDSYIPKRTATQIDATVSEAVDHHSLEVFKRYVDKLERIKNEEVLLVEQAPAQDPVPDV